MTGTDRRGVLRLAAAALLLPMVSAGIARAATPARFAPPAGLMLYARRLERAMGGGHRFVVERRFAVRFVPVARGYRVEGEQVGVAVEAPDALAEFARIEREREEVGLFPLLLDADGGIAGGMGTPLATRLDEAVRIALGQVEARAQAPAARSELERFVTAFHQGATRLMTELPRDLFAPGSPRHETRDVALPGGDSGAVTVSFAAIRDPATGMMREALREVVTTLDGGQRRTLENWTLAPYQT